MLAAGLSEAPGQSNRIENLVQLLGGQIGAFAGHLTHGATGAHGFGGDVGRMLISDVVVECGGDRRRGLGILASQTDVDLDALHAIDAECLHGVSPVVKAEAERRCMHVVDATCPLVGKVHREVLRFVREG